MTGWEVRERVSWLDGLVMVTWVESTLRVTVWFASES